jgi:hypothetical protein
MEIIVTQNEEIPFIDSIQVQFNTVGYCLENDAVAGSW